MHVCIGMRRYHSCHSSKCILLWPLYSAYVRGGGMRSRTRLQPGQLLAAGSMRNAGETANLPKRGAAARKWRTSGFQQLMAWNVNTANINGGIASVKAGVISWRSLCRRGGEAEEMIICVSSIISMAALCNPLRSIREVCDDLYLFWYSLCNDSMQILCEIFVQCSEMKRYYYCWNVVFYLILQSIFIFSVILCSIVLSWNDWAHYLQ